MTDPKESGWGNKVKGGVSFSEMIKAKATAKNASRIQQPLTQQEAPVKAEKVVEAVVAQLPEKQQPPPQPAAAPQANGHHKEPCYHAVAPAEGREADITIGGAVPLSPRPDTNGPAAGSFYSQTEDVLLPLGTPAPLAIYSFTSEPQVAEPSTVTAPVAAPVQEYRRPQVRPTTTHPTVPPQLHPYHPQQQQLHLRLRRRRTGLLFTNSVQSIYRQGLDKTRLGCKTLLG